MVTKCGQDISIRQITDIRTYCAFIRIKIKNELSSGVLSHYCLSFKRQVNWDRWFQSLKVFFLLQGGIVKGSHLTSELIPASLSLNWFSHLGVLGWKNIAHLFRNRQEVLLHMPFQTCKEEWSWMTRSVLMERHSKTWVCALLPEGHGVSVWVPYALPEPSLEPQTW